MRIVHTAHLRGVCPTRGRSEDSCRQEPSRFFGRTLRWRKRRRGSLRNRRGKPLSQGNQPTPPLVQRGTIDLHWRVLHPWCSIPTYARLPDLPPTPLDVGSVPSSRCLRASGTLDHPGQRAFRTAHRTHGSRRRILGEGGYPRPSECATGSDSFPFFGRAIPFLRRIGPAPVYERKNPLGSKALFRSLDYVKAEGCLHYLGNGSYLEGEGSIGERFGHGLELEFA